MISRGFSLAVSLLVSLLVTPLRAQCPGVTFGFQSSFWQPTGGEFNVKEAYGLGLHAAVDTGDGYVVRPTLDYIHYDQTFQIMGIAVTESDKMTLLTVDQLYYFQGEALGGYMLLGVGGHSINYKLSARGASVGASATGLAYSVGFGAAFTKNVFMETKYTVFHVGSFDILGLTVPAHTGKAVVVSLGATF